MSFQPASRAALAGLAFAASTALALCAMPAVAAPKTAIPDLEGSWTSSTLTPFVRPAKFGDRAVLTPQEVAEVEGETARINELANKPTDPNATVKDLPADCSGGRGANCNYNSAWTDPGEKVMTVHGEKRSSLITSPANGQIPFKPEFAARFQRRGGGTAQPGSGEDGPPGSFDNPENRALGERCLTSFGYSSGPVMLPSLYNNTYQIVQTKDEVAILVEMVHDVRHVRLNAKHRTDGVRPWFGDSIGWYEGPTLVIETTQFHPLQKFYGAGDDLKVTERLTRVSKDRLLYQFKVESPSTFTQPWGGEYEFSTSGPVFEYACHEGNYGLEGILAGARAREAQQATAQAAAKP